MARHFEFKRELFGDDKLVKDITLDDMDEDDLDAFATASLIPLKERDQSGRTVLWHSPPHFRTKHWKNYVSLETSITVDGMVASWCFLT